MRWFPAFLNLQKREVLVVGGGEVALRKTKALMRSGALVTVFAPELCAELVAWQQQGKLRWLHGKKPGSLSFNQYAVIVAATDDDSVNATVSRQAQALNIPVNVVDAPQLSSFIVPSVLDRSPLVVAVSSGGDAPVLARMIRAKLETLIPAEFGGLATLMGQFRADVKEKLPFSQRRRFWESVVDGAVAEQCIAGHDAAAEKLLKEKLAEWAQGNAANVQGEVFLVGAGPGDPDLLTFKALRLMQQCDVVLYDRLVSQRILDLVRKDAEFVHVGKQRDQHVVPQQGINELLVEHASQGKRVLRLKGGDPFIFGRGGEEIQELAAAGIPFQVVPGITAASGCSSYSGIPLTHRDYAQSCRFVTGHLKDGQLDLDWPALAAPAQTVVFYMGLTSLPLIAEQLQQHGAPASRLAAVIEKGTEPEQRVITGSLATIAEQATAAEVQSPALLIVGDVVELRETLGWF